MDKYILIVIATPLIIGWLLDIIFGDPTSIPHPIVGFGKIISWSEKKLNRGNYIKLKGAISSILLIIGVFTISFTIILISYKINIIITILLNTITVFFCLAGKTLRKEVQGVFKSLEISVEKGRNQVARIVGRETSKLNDQEIKKAALETLAENLSDGVIAPIFWYLILGAPGMLTYKMINTLDSMIGYKNNRYINFGCVAAKIDDFANYIPSRLTSCLMILVNGNLSLFSFILKYAKCHSSPNAGYPESALAGILNCQFGGPNIYFNKIVEKPYIGNNPRELTTSDMHKAIKINMLSEQLFILICIIIYTITYCIIL